MFKLSVITHAVLCGLICVGSNSQAQDVVRDSTRVSSGVSWFTRRDLLRSGGATLGVASISLADEQVAKYSQRGWLQRSSGLRNSADVIQTIGDPLALLLSASLFAAGKITHRPALAEASWHSTEAIIASGAITRVFKVGIGRARPNLTGGKDAYVFLPTRGYRTDFNSLPSGHATAAFAAASVFSAELKRSHPKAARIASPVLYGVASLVGASRIYNNRHWLSDVVGGALVGQFAGRRIVAHAYGRDSRRSVVADSSRR